MEDYPTEEQLKPIRLWGSNNNINEILKLLEEIWHNKDWGFKLTGKRIKKLELHTGGWSGNEEIIEALQKNFLFWSLYWVKSVKGGHYYFRIYELKGE